MSTEPAKFPQTTAAVLALLAGGVAFFVNRLGIDTGVQQTVTMVLVGAAALLFPSIHLKDPTNDETITRDSQFSSLLLAIGGAVAGYIIPNLPLPESLDGTLAALLVTLTGLLVPNALPGRRVTRSRVAETIRPDRSDVPPEKRHL